VVDLHGLNRWFLLVLAAVLWAVGSQEASASVAVAPSSPWTFSAPGYGNCGSTPVYTYTGTTPTAAVSQAFAKWNSCDTSQVYTLGSCASYDDATATSVACAYTDKTLWDNQVYNRSVNVTRTLGACPANSTASGGACQCNTGFVEDGTHTSCQSANQAACALAKGMTFYSSSPGRGLPGGTVCLETGCNGQWQGTVIYTDKTTGQAMTEGPVTYDGSSCSYVPGGAATATKDACPGGSLGTVNGVSTCVPYDPTKNTVESVDTKNTTAQTTATPASGASSSSTGPTTSTQDQTKCDGGKCTTTETTTTTNSDGSKTVTTTTKDQPQTDFCKDNPKATMCQDAGTFSGSCGSSYACTGDAVLCAAAVAMQQEKCALVDGPAGSNAVKAAYDSAASASSSGVGTTTLAISSANFDSSNSLGVGAACIADLSVTVWGTVQTIQVSKVCPWLSTLGTIMLALAWLSAAVIVGKGVTG
jgi:hypothetical protein